MIATRQFNVPYQMVQFSHGKVGIATLVMVYSQVGAQQQQQQQQCASLHRVQSFQ
jgi:hypothetical protein